MSDNDSFVYHIVPFFRLEILKKAFYGALSLNHRNTFVYNSYNRSGVINGKNDYVV